MELDPSTLYSDYCYLHTLLPGNSACIRDILASFSYSGRKWIRIYHQFYRHWCQQTFETVNSYLESPIIENASYRYLFFFFK